jgi:hypothetical protein
MWVCRGQWGQLLPFENVACHEFHREVRKQLMNIAILYAREMHGQSLQEQLDMCRRFAEAQGYVPVAALIDFQTPGPAYRLGLRGVLDMVTAGDVPMLVAVSSQHISKDPVRLEALHETLRERSCEVRYVVDEP